MKATFLESDVPLTKTFRMKDGRVDKIGHPRVINYTSHEETFETLEELHELLKSHAGKNHCFLKGNTGRKLVKESRAGTTNPNELTNVLLLDLDGVKSVSTVEEFLDKLGLKDIDYIVQYSASMGVVPDRGLSAHIFMLLDKPILPAALKQYLINWNLTNSMLKDGLELTASFNALRWTLDVTTCQSDKLIYIAPPIVKDGIEDKFVGERIQLVKKQHRTVSLAAVPPTAEKNKTLQEDFLNSLRAKQGLDKRPKDQFKSAGNTEYLVHPDRATVTGIRVTDEFTYLNLNGGDSWAYWHPTNNPEFIRNFKGEPVYRTKDLCPDYWDTVKDQINERKPDADGIIYLGFRDFRTAQYYNGTYNPKTDKLNIAQAKSAAQVHDFFRQHNQPVGDFIPDMDLVFDPHSDKVVDFESNTINTFQPTIYMKAKPKKGATLPPTVRKLMMHATGNDEDVLEHLLNMMACVFQYRKRCGTGIILHGVQGTGKGLFLDRILRPIFGNEYVVTKRMREINTQFNGYMEKAFWMWVDEAEQSDFRDKGLVNADLKNFITEPRISIRKMYTAAYEVENYMTWILASNQGHIIKLDPDDRRFTVCVYQEEKLDPTDEELRTLDSELMDFAVYLASRPADQNKARKPLNNTAKQKMIQLNRIAIDAASDAILAGNLEFFYNLMPQGELELLPRYEQEAARQYQKLIEHIIKDNPATLTREELFVMLEYTVGGMPSKAGKFTALIKHHKLAITPINRGGKTFRGLNVKWKILPEMLEGKQTG